MAKKVENWKRRFFVLHSDDRLTYYKDERSMANQLGFIDFAKVYSLNR